MRRRYAEAERGIKVAIAADSPTSPLRDMPVGFCCKNCKPKFDADPRQYVRKILEPGRRSGGRS